ncbi:MAG: chloride channel protein [Bacteroidota bacterium]|nr:chloride channel protein [Bacteroidota bacterium]
MRLFLKHILWAVIIAVAVGLVAALFLVSLDFVTQLRLENNYLLIGLPFAGLAIGLLYHYAGAPIAAGNNLFIHSFQDTQVKVNWRMAPMVFVGTILTHLFGGSAGREGTAVQMGGSIAAQLSYFAPSTPFEKRLLLLMGIGAGFAAVFGTPLAGFIFAFELLWVRKSFFTFAIPVLLACFLAHFICIGTGISHTVFPPLVLPQFSFVVVFNIVVASILFGLAAQVFIATQHYFSKAFSYIQFPPFRTALAGGIIALLVGYFDAYKYTGLGVSEIVLAFTQPQEFYVFALKIFFTTFTLSAGFKGGEVTPLFFIGATLGSALVWFIPLPISFLAALGLIAVFAGASNTPLACIIMGAELFGANAIFYMALSCFVAFLSSGFKGIYSSHPMGKWKSDFYFKYLKPRFKVFK